MTWTGLQGLGAGLGAAALLPFVQLDRMVAAPAPDLWRFWGWAALMGLAGSWFATVCWVAASRRLPLALSAQLIVGETVFGLAYGFAYEARWPTSAEAVGAGLQLAGVVMAVALFGHADKRALNPEPIE